MGGYEELIAGIKDVVRRNGRREITGDALQQVLVGMVSAIGANSAFAGVANPETDPGSPDANVFWIAAQPGTYTHFGNAVVTASAVLSNETGEWVATPLNFGEPYKPIPEFFFTSRVSTYYDSVSVQYQRKYCLYTSSYTLHLYGAARYGVEGMRIEFYPYTGQDRRRPPYSCIPAYSKELSEIRHYVHGNDIAIPLDIDSMNLMWYLGVRGANSLSDIVEFYDDIDSFVQAIIDERVPSVKMYKRGGKELRGAYRELSYNYHGKYQNGTYVQPGKFTPIITLRFAAALSRGEETGPRQQYRIGIYSMKKPGGESGIATSESDYFIRVGYIQRIDKAYRY